MVVTAFTSEGSGLPQRRSAGAKTRRPRAAFDAQQSPGIRTGRCPCSHCLNCPGRAEPVKSAYGVGSADLRLLTEPARESRSLELLGAGTGMAEIIQTDRAAMPRQASHKLLHTADPTRPLPLTGLDMQPSLLTEINHRLRCLSVKASTSQHAAVRNSGKRASTACAAGVAWLRCAMRPGVHVMARPTSGIARTSGRLAKPPSESVGTSFVSCKKIPDRAIDGGRALKE